MMNFLKELKSRWIAKTPAFWITVQRILLAISVAATVGLSQPQLMPSWALEPLKIAAFCGIFGTFLAQLTKDSGSPQASENKTQAPNSNQQNSTT
jgi:hypothetical protein